MRFVETAIVGVFLVETEPARDQRGFFARLHCEDEFARRGLVSRFAQTSLSHNIHAGTVRGMHWSQGEGAETKLLCCVRGAIADRLVDLRPGSSSFGVHLAVDLSDENGLGLYVPAGVAHGFQALEAGSDVLYMIDVAHDPSAARGARWDDPFFSIVWPQPISEISERDRTWPDFTARP